MFDVNDIPAEENLSKGILSKDNEDTSRNNDGSSTLNECQTNKLREYDRKKDIALLDLSRQETLDTSKAQSSNSQDVRNSNSQDKSKAQSSNSLGNSNTQYPNPKDKSNVQYPNPKVTSNTQSTNPQDMSNTQSTNPQDMSNTQSTNPQDMSNTQSTNPQDMSNTQSTNPQDKSNIQSTNPKDTSNTHSLISRDSTEEEDYVPMDWPRTDGLGTQENGETCEEVCLREKSGQKSGVLRYSVSNVSLCTKVIRLQVTHHISSLVFEGKDAEALSVIDKPLHSLLDVSGAPQGLQAYVKSQYRDSKTLMDLVTAFLISIIDAIRYRSLFHDLVQKSVLEVMNCMFGKYSLDVLKVALTCLTSLFQNQHILPQLSESTFLKEGKRDYIKVIRCFTNRHTSNTGTSQGCE
ncbi:uncharacterized protein LOC134279473 [Saccostrea cucullata]|uniref:uncharacterized protein LOC134279473 n=1 Tax=Saccostrea cuccullata TaxID=36930 RepID=UPI002ED57299